MYSAASPFATTTCCTHIPAIVPASPASGVSTNANRTSIHQPPPPVSHSRTASPSTAAHWQPSPPAASTAESSSASLRTVGEPPISRSRHSSASRTVASASSGSGAPCCRRMAGGAGFAAAEAARPSPTKASCSLPACSHWVRSPPPVGCRTRASSTSAMLRGKYNARAAINGRDRPARCASSVATLQRVTTRNEDVSPASF
jgi:hypothetical protein